jgi:hypothetical protein
MSRGGGGSLKPRCTLTTLFVNQGIEGHVQVTHVTQILVQSDQVGQESSGQSILDKGAR